MIALTRRLIIMLLALLGAAFGQTQWIASARVGNEARFLYGQTIQRYDLVQQNWLAAYPLPFGNVTAMAADASGSVITTGTAIYRGAADFSGQTPLATAPGYIWALYLDGNLVIVVHESSGSGSSGSGSVTTYDRTTGVKISNQYPYANGLIGTSLAPQSRRLYGSNRSDSAGGLITISYNSDGTVGDTLPSPYHGNMPRMSRTWVFPDETKVMDDAGTVYSAPGMKFLGGLGGAVTDVAWNGTTAIVLRAGKLYAYGADLLEAGRASTSPTGAGVFVNGTNAYVFSPSGTRPVASIVPLSSIVPVVPGSPVNPLGAAFTPDSVYYATNGDVILFSKALKSLFRWSAASHSYTQSVPLLDAPAYAAYSKDSDLVYLVYPNGAIDKVDFTASQPQEVRLASVSTVPNGLAAAGNFAVLSTNTTTTGVDHYIFDSTGTLRSIYSGGYVIGSSWAWDPATRKLYFFGLSALSNEMIDQTGTVITTGQISFSGNLYGTPIRLSADGKKVVLGNGTIYSIGQFQSELLATVTSPVVDAVWSGDRLLTLVKNGVSSQILAWSGAKYTQEATTLAVNGTPASLTPFGDSFVATTVVGGVPRYTIFDSTLKVVYTSPSQPVSPASLAFTSRTTTTVDLQWQDLSDNETGFLVEYRPSGGGAWLSGPTTAAGVVAAQVIGLTAGTTYDFRVSAVADSLVSTPSASITTSTYASGDQPAGEPYLLTAARIFANQITLQWQDNATNETSFQLYRSTSANSLGTAIILPANTTSYVDTGLAANTTYYYHVQTFNGGLGGDLSATVSARTLASNGVPAKPGSVTVTSVAAGIINVSWTDLSTNEDQYVILRVSYPGNGLQEVGRVGYNVTSFTDTTAVPNVTYYYQVVASNSSGQSSAVDAPTSVTTPKAGGDYTGLCCQNGGVYYFAFLGPMRVERYDMAAGQWLTPVALSDTPGALWVDESGIYVGEGKAVVRYNLDGTHRTVLATAGSAISSMFTLGRVLGYGVPQFATGTGITTIDKATGQVLSSFGSKDDARIFSIAPSRNRVFGRSYGYSSGNMAYMEINQDGILVDSGEDPYSYTYDAGQRAFVFPNDARVADDTGNVYSTDSVTHLTTLGPAFTDLAFYGIDVPIVLRYDTVYAYDNLFHQTGSASAGLSGFRVAVQGTNALVFGEDVTNTHGIQIKTVPLSQLNAPVPGQPTDPRGLAFAPDDLFQDNDGNVLLFSRFQTSLFRWSPAEGTYIATIPLTGVPDHAAYSKENDAAYFEYATKLVTKLDLGAAAPKEETLFHLNQQPNGLATAGSYVVARDAAGVWGTHYVLRPDGTLADSSDMRFPSSAYAWDEVKRRLYYFWEYSGPSGLLFETIDASGKITGGLEQPGDRSVSLSGPIRVSPDGSKLAFGSGPVMETDGLTLLDNVTVGFTDAVWRDSSFVTIQTGSAGTDVKQWDPVTLSPGSTLASLTGTPLRIFGLDRNRLVVVTLDQGMPRFYILSATGAVVLDYVSTTPHLVGAPPAATEDLPYSWQPQIEVSPGSSATTTVAAVSLPPWLALVDGTLVGTPLEADSGDPQTPEVYHQAVLSLTDSSGGTSQRTFDIPVIWVNDPPVLPAPADIPPLVTNNHGDPVTLDFGPLMQDPDRNDPHTWDIIADTDAGIFSNLSLDSNGLLTAVFAPYVSGSALVTIQVKDSSDATATTTVSVTLPDLPAPTVNPAGQIVLNRATGLYDQTVTVTNTAGRAIGGFDLTILSLQPGVVLYNGKANGNGGFVLAYHQPLQSGQSVTLTLEYYEAVRGSIPQPVFSTSLALPEAAVVSTASVPGFAVDRMVMQSDGSFVLEFPAQAGHKYQVEYSNDAAVWKVCPYPILSGGNRVQWIDRGPPWTDALPSSVPHRFYRIQSLDN